MVRVTGLSRDKFTMGNIHTQGRKGNEVFFYFNMKPPKNGFLTVLFRTVERKIDVDMADYTSR